MSAMRILVATDQWFPDYRGGSARIAADSASVLAARGHEVTVLAPPGRAEADDGDVPSLDVRRVIRRSALPQTLTDPLRTRSSARRLRRPFDVLVAHQTTTAAGLLAARLSLPLVLVHHASALRELRFVRGRLEWSPGRLASFALDPVLAVMDRGAVRRADRVLVLSDFNRTLLIQDHPDVAPRVRHVRGAVDTARFTPGEGMEAARSRLGLDTATPLLFTARRLEPRMGLEQLLLAVRRIVHEKPISLVVAGTGSLGRDLRRLAADRGLEADVRFLGEIDDDELATWYQAADAVVLPTVAYEGFGLVTAEALASGTPVVGTPVGATPELLRPLDPRLVARDSAPDALADAITETLAFTSAELRSRCRSYAVERFSWDQAIGSWEDAIAEAAGRATPSETPDIALALETVGSGRES